MRAAGMVAPWLGVDDVKCGQSARAYGCHCQRGVPRSGLGVHSSGVGGFDLRRCPNYSLQSWDTLGILMGGRSVRACVPSSLGIRVCDCQGVSAVCACL